MTDSVLVHQFNDPVIIAMVDPSNSGLYKRVAIRAEWITVGPGGEIGRRKGLKILWRATSVWVQVPPRAPHFRFEIRRLGDGDAAENSGGVSQPSRRNAVP